MFSNAGFARVSSQRPWILLRRNTRRSGFALITTIYFIMIISVLLAGVGTFATSTQINANVDANTAKALNIAEAGINYEMNKITRNYLTADQAPGATYTFGGGSYKVWVTTNDPTQPTGEST